MRHMQIITVVSILLSAISITKVHAGLIIDIADDGNDLVVNVSGSFNYGTISTFNNIGTGSGLVGAGNLQIFQYIVSNDLQQIPIALGVTDTSNWSSLFFQGSQLLPLSSVAGKSFGGWRIDANGLIIPENYSSGDPWVSSARVVGPITVKPASGSYATFTLNETGDTVTMRYESSFTPGTTNAAVPEPSTAIAMGFLGILGFAGNRRRRRQKSVA